MHHRRTQPFLQTDAKHRAGVVIAVLAIAVSAVLLSIWPTRPPATINDPDHNSGSNILDLRLYASLTSTEVGWPTNDPSMHFTRADVPRVRVWLDPATHFITDVEMIDFERDESHAVRKAVLWLPPLPPAQACTFLTALDRLFTFELGAHRDMFEQLVSQLCGATGDTAGRTWRKHLYGTTANGRVNVGSSAGDPNQIDISLHLTIERK